MCNFLTLTLTNEGIRKLATQITEQHSWWGAPLTSATRLLHSSNKCGCCWFQRDGRTSQKNRDENQFNNDQPLFLHLKSLASWHLLGHFDGTSSEVEKESLTSLSLPKCLVRSCSSDVVASLCSSTAPQAHGTTKTAYLLVVSFQDPHKRFKQVQWLTKH